MFNYVYPKCVRAKCTRKHSHYLGIYYLGSALSPLFAQLRTSMDYESTYMKFKAEYTYLPVSEYLLRKVLIRKWDEGNF